MTPKDQAILEIIYVKKSSNQIDWKKFGVKNVVKLKFGVKKKTKKQQLKKRTFKLLEMTESICCFYKYQPKSKKSPS